MGVSTEQALGEEKWQEKGGAQAGFFCDTLPVLVSVSRSLVASLISHLRHSVQPAPVGVQRRG